MRLMTDEKIQQLTRDKILELMNLAHYQPLTTASLSELQTQLADLQRTRTLEFWHDHSTVLQQGYILFAVKVVYDTGVFLTEKEWQADGNTIRDLQEEVEQPTIHMIAPSTSAVSDQLALVSDRLECLKELSQPISDPNGIAVFDKARFFCGDKPAQQFERGTQIGGLYKCGSCWCRATMIQDFSHTAQCPPRSLECLQGLVTAGRHQGIKLKPLEKLLVSDLKTELLARGFDISGKNKPQLQSILSEELKGAQRVPSLLVTNPTQSISGLNLQEYEILSCEPLHDLKGHSYNLLQEIPHLLPQYKDTFTQIIDSTLQETASGVHLRTAVIKVYLKLLKLQDVDEDVKQLLGTLVKISQLLYLPDSGRSPKTVLQLYNVTWLHHELCCKLIPNPKAQTRDRLYGTYFHDFVVHAPPQFQIVCLRSSNSESTERLFSQIKHISQRATNRKPENGVATILLSMQAKEQTGTNSLSKQSSTVSEAAK